MCLCPMYTLVCSAVCIVGLGHIFCTHKRMSCLTWLFHTFEVSMKPKK